MSQPNPSPTTIMNAQLDTIISKLEKKVDEGKSAIADAALGGDFEKVQRITDATKKVTAICEELKQQEKLLKKASKELDASLAPVSKAPQTRLRVSLILNEDWPTQVIEEDKAAETLQKFILAVIQGDYGKLEKISDIICGGCGLVSQFPKRDFINPKKGTPYAFLPIGNSGWFVKTSTSTKQKDQQIREIVKVLNLPSDCVQIEIVTKIN